jgi:hypothetical protein
VVDGAPDDVDAPGDATLDEADVEEAVSAGEDDCPGAGSDEHAAISAAASVADTAPATRPRGRWSRGDTASP